MCKLLFAPFDKKGILESLIFLRISAFSRIRSMRMTGLEPARRGHQNLNLARLPIPPHPHISYRLRKK